jgi:hypothetical protein
MKRNTAWIAAALALPLCGAAHFPADELRFKPAEGLKLRKLHLFESTGELDSVHLFFEGDEHEIPADERGDMRFEQSMKLAFTDEYVRVEGAAVRELVRRFDELEQSSITTEDGEATTLAAASELEERSVRFTWDAELGAHVASWVEEGAAAELLSGLRFDCDASGLLPREPVALDAVWEIPVEEFRYALDPGGDLQLLDEQDDERSRALDRALSAGLEGEVRATYRGLREEDGRTLAVIAIEAELSARVERDAEEEVDEGESLKEIFAVEHECAGELLWDPAAGHLVSLELASEMLFTDRTSGRIESESGGAVDFGQVVRVRASATQRSSFAKVD